MTNLLSSSMTFHRLSITIYPTCYGRPSSATKASSVTPSSITLPHSLAISVSQSVSLFSLLQLPPPIAQLSAPAGHIRRTQTALFSRINGASENTANGPPHTHTYTRKHTVSVSPITLRLSHRHQHHPTATACHCIRPSHQATPPTKKQVSQPYKLSLSLFLLPYLPPSLYRNITPALHHSTHLLFYRIVRPASI